MLIVTDPLSVGGSARRPGCRLVFVEAPPGYQAISVSVRDCSFNPPPRAAIPGYFWGGHGEKKMKCFRWSSKAPTTSQPYFTNCLNYPATQLVCKFRKKDTLISFSDVAKMFWTVSRVLLGIFSLVLLSRHLANWYMCLSTIVKITCTNGNCFTHCFIADLARALASFTFLAVIKWMVCSVAWRSQLSRG